MQRRMIGMWVMVGVLLLLGGCGQGSSGEEDAAQPPAATEAVVAPTATAEPEPTPTAEPVAQAVPVSPIALPPEGTDGFPWWNDTVWYEIFVRSYHDSDGDGVGDLQGLIQKLDYLNDGDPATTTDLGVTGLWLMPVAESPSYHGYDVVDYYAIDEEYGTEEDFKQLMEEAHRRGIRVIVDMVLNHTSSAHPWFQAARAGDPAFVEWYRFIEGEKPRQSAPWGGGGSAWHEAGANRYYYGVFWSEMPDLNYENPEVTAEAQAISRFWLEELGADGFRLDGIRLLIEGERLQENTEQTHSWLKAYQSFLDSVRPDAFAIGEVWTTTDKVVPYLTNDELDSAFEFSTATAMLAAARDGNAGPIRIAHSLDVKFYPPNEYATFLTNHDQDRVASVLRDMDKLRVAASMLLTGPGVPFLYYGEEVAMTGRKPDEDIRKPMPWNGEAGGGFTEGRPWRALPEGYEENNVAAMLEDPESLLSHYRRLIALRNEHEALRIGEHMKINSSTSAVYPFVRQSDEETLIVLINLTEEAISGYELELDAGSIELSDAPTELLHGVTAAAPTLDEAGSFAGYTPIETLEPYTTYVIQLRP